VSLPVATEPVGSNVLEEDSEDDGFFNDEEDDPIAKAEIEVDAGFRLE
jgi:hypothetical protein